MVMSCWRNGIPLSSQMRLCSCVTLVPSLSWHHHEGPRSAVVRGADMRLAGLLVRHRTSRQMRQCQGPGCHKLPLETQMVGAVSLQWRSPILASGVHSQKND